MMKKIILFLVCTMVLLGGVVAWEAFTFLNYKSASSSEESEKILLDVPPGRTFIAVTNELHRLGFINNTRYFRLYARLTGDESKLKIGEYEISRSMGPVELLRVITSGQSFARSLTIPEGTNMYDIAALLESRGFGPAQDFLKLFKDQNFIQSLLGERVYSLEGYLFPETYHYTKYTNDREIVAGMVRNFLRAYAQIQVPTGNTLSRHEVVTLASVIEKETGAPEERPMISSVFHNRLRKKMRLQSDPTILYGILDQTGAMKKNITRKDITEYTRYNTYRVSALPFGPIANPGSEALRAVFYPETSNYIFFVSRNDGTHVFSETLEQHNSAVRAFQLDPKAREGRSWRDLKNRGRTSN